MEADRSRRTRKRSARHRRARIGQPTMAAAGVQTKTRSMRALSRAAESQRLLVPTATMIENRGSRIDGKKKSESTTGGDSADALMHKPELGRRQQAAGNPRSERLSSLRQRAISIPGTAPVRVSHPLPYCSHVHTSLWAQSLRNTRPQVASRAIGDSSNSRPWHGGWSGSALGIGRK